jgi:hypothetical protein
MRSYLRVRDREGDPVKYMKTEQRIQGYMV